MPTSALNRWWNREGDKFTARASVSGDHARWRFSCMRATAVRTRGSMRHHFLRARIRDRSLRDGGRKAKLYSEVLCAGHRTSRIRERLSVVRFFSLKVAEEHRY